MQKAPTICQPMHVPLNRLQCPIRIVEETAGNSNGDSVIFKYFKIPSRKKGAIIQKQICSILGSFLSAGSVLFAVIWREMSKLICRVLKFCGVIHMVVSVFNIVCYRTVKTAPPHDINNLFSPDFI
jgi:hypothetical protein